MAFSIANLASLFPFPKPSFPVRRRLVPPPSAASAARSDGHCHCTAAFRSPVRSTSPAVPAQSITLEDLLHQSGITPASFSGDLNTAITGIQHDSRAIVPGDLFICRVGSKSDGHDHLSEALTNGAVAVLSDRGFDQGETPFLGFRSVITVENTHSAIPLLASSFYSRPSEKLPVIGVTGTNGKTTTTHLIKCLYESMGFKTGLIGTVGYYIRPDLQLEAPNTTPDALLLQKLVSDMVVSGAGVVVMEVSSHGLALGRCDEIDFDVAVFTNLTRDHLDFHGSMDEYRESKGKLFDRMLDPQKHRKVVNVDDPSAPFFLSRGNPGVPTVTFGMENREADVRPLDFHLSLFGARISVRTPKGDVEICSKLIGRFNVCNVLAAVAVGIAVDAPLEAIARGIEGMGGVAGRCELIDEGQDFSVIVDYAHTPDALTRLMDAVRELRPKRIITVFGCGGERDKGKRPLMTRVAAEKSDATILTSDNSRNEDPMDILDDMLDGVGWTIRDYQRVGQSDCYPPLSNNHRIFVHENRRVALRAAIAMGRADDIIVVAGKGHETYQIEGDRKNFFDDRQECREAIQAVKKLRQDGTDGGEFTWW